MRLRKNANSSNGKAGKKMKDKIFKDLWIKIVSIIMAFGLWIIVVSVDDPTVTRSFTQIPVELLNADVLTNGGNYFEVADNTDAITVLATGKRSVIDSMSKDNFRATADIEKLDGNLVPIDVRATKYADRLESVTARTANVRLDIEGLLQKQVDIVVMPEGNVSEGCILGNVTADRSVVKVSGPESVIQTITAANAYVDITGLSSDINTVAELEFIDEDGDSVEDERIKSNISSVTAKIEVWGSKEVPVVYGYVGAPLEGYGLNGESYVSPSTIKIATSKSELNNITEVTIPANAIDITGAMSDMDIPVNMVDYLPSGVVLYGEEETNVIVHIGVSPLLSKNVQVSTSNIALLNVPEGMNASIAEPNEFVIAEVSGIGNGFINLDETAITGIADLSAIVIGEESEEIQDNIYDVPIVLECPAGIVAKKDMVIKVLLTKASEEGDNTEESN